MYTDNKKEKIIKPLRVSLNRLKLFVFFSIGILCCGIFCHAQDLSLAVKKEKNLFTSYLLVLQQKDSPQTIEDSLRIRVPFQDIEWLDHSFINNKIYVLYESDGTNRITRGLTLTLMKFSVEKNRLVGEDSVKIFRGLNSKMKDLVFSIDKQHLEVRDKNQKAKVYDLSLNRKYSEVVEDILADFSNPKPVSQ